LSLDLTHLDDDSLPESDDPDPPEEGAATGELAAGGATADPTDEDSAAEGAGFSYVDDGAAVSEGEATADEADRPDTGGAAVRGPAPPPYTGGPGKMNWLWSCDMSKTL
jgi:hypothetical protein